MSDKLVFYLENVGLFAFGGLKVLTSNVAHCFALNLSVFHNFFIGSQTDQPAKGDTTLGKIHQPKATLPPSKSKMEYKKNTKQMMVSDIKNF